MPKRKDGRYKVTVQINKKRYYFMGRTLKEAKDKRSAFLDLLEKCPLATQKVTLSEWMQAWLESITPNISPVTKRDYYYTIKKYITEARIGRILLTDLTPAMFRSYLADLLKEKSPRTVNNLHTILHAALKQAAEDGAIPVSPLTNIKHAKQERKEVSILRQSQIKEMLDLIPEEWTKLYFRIAAYTGLRMGEISGLDCKWGIDFKRGTIKVMRSVIRVNGKEQLSYDLKNKSSRRTISVDRETMKLIQHHISAMKGTPNPENLLFCDAEGNPIKRNYIEKIARRTFNAMGLPDFTFHGLRHTHATLLLKEGINFKALQHRLGHSTFQQTMDTYGHFIPDLEVGVKETLKKII